MALKISSELGILLRDGVLSNMRQQEKRQEGRENTQTRRDPEGILRLLHFVGTCGCQDGREDSGADECADLANSRGDTVVLSANTSGAGLGGDETDVVARAQLTEGEENAVDYSERGDVAGFGEGIVASGHDEADHGLEGDSNHQSISRSNLIRERSAEHGAGDVEEVDDCVPAKSGRERDIVTNDVADDGRRVNTEGEGGELSGLALFLEGGMGFDIHRRGTISTRR